LFTLLKKAWGEVTSYPTRIVTTHLQRWKSVTTPYGVGGFLILLSLKMW